MVVIKSWKKISCHCYCQTLVLVNRTLFSCQLFKVMERKLHWHIIKVKRREDLRKLSHDKNVLPSIPFILGILFQ